VAEKLKEWLCWNSVLRYLIESYLLIAFSCFINIREMSYEDSGSVASSWSTYIGLGLLALVPIFVF